MKKFFRLRQLTRNSGWIILSLVFALWALVLWVQEDPWAVQRAERKLTSLLSSLYDCRMSGSITRIRLFRGHLLMHNVHAEGDGWHWDSPRVAIAWSWTDLLTIKGILKLTLLFDQTVMHSRLDPHAKTINAALPIMGHIQKWLEPTKFAIPLAINSLTLQKTTLHVAEQPSDPAGDSPLVLSRVPPSPSSSKRTPQPLVLSRVEGYERAKKLWRAGSGHEHAPKAGYTGTCHFFLSTFGASTSWETVIGVSDMQANQNGTLIGTARNGLLTWHVPFDRTQAPVIQATIQATPAQYLPGTYTTKLDWKDRQWAGTLTQRDGPLAVTGTLDQANLRITGTLPLGTLTSLVPEKYWPLEEKNVRPLPAHPDHTHRPSPLVLSEVEGHEHEKHESRLQGNAQITATMPVPKIGETWGASIDTDMRISNVQIAGYSVPDITLELKKRDTKITGAIQTIQAFPGLASTWQLDGSWHGGRATITLPPLVELPGVTINNGTCTLHATWQPKLMAQGSFSAKVALQQAPVPVPVTGNFQINPELVQVSGSWDKIPITVQLALKAPINLPVIPDSTLKKHKIALAGHLDGRFKTSIQLDLLAPFVKNYGIALEGERGTGRLTATGKRNPDGTLQLNWALEQCRIYVPGIQTVIRQASGIAELNLSKHELVSTNLRLQLARGTITASHARITLDDQWALQTAYLPLQIQDYFASWKNHAWTSFSGLIRLEYVKNTPPRVHGMLVLDRTYLNENLLSAEFRRALISTLPLVGSGTNMPAYILRQAQDERVQTELVPPMRSSTKNTLQPLVLSKVEGHERAIEGANTLPDWLKNCQLDLSCSTKTPIEMKTSFWDAQIHAGITCTGTATNPIWGGEARFVEGSLAFPYRPLFITRGSLKLDPHNLQDPVISLIARNTIKKFAVELQLSGTAQAPVVELDSSPPLDREEILTLLLSGSEDGALGIAVPRVLMENVEQLLTGSGETVSWTRRYLGTLFSPFKYFKIIPRFTDQKGRGGLKGVVTVEFNDRLRGSVEKNFSLPEDVMVQGEYDLTDDTALRILRDERGDWGGEAEMRWKW